MFVALVPTFAVDRHRRRDDEPRGAARPGEEPLEECGGGHGVPADVAVDLVHGLPDADCCRQVDDGVHADEGSIGHVGITDVAGNERGARRDGGLASVVDLVLERIDDDDIVAASDEPHYEVRADEAGPSRDQDTHTKNRIKKARKPALAERLDSGRPRIYPNERRPPRPPLAVGKLTYGADTYAAFRSFTMLIEARRRDSGRRKRRRSSFLLR
jgi:hypothetical protein